MINDLRLMGGFVQRAVIGRVESDVGSGISSLTPKQTRVGVFLTEKGSSVLIVKRWSRLKVRHSARIRSKVAGLVHGPVMASGKIQNLGLITTQTTKGGMMAEEQELDREAIAATVHEIWIHWMEYLYSKGRTMPSGDFIIDFDDYFHWMQQMEKSYHSLSEREKESDRDQADKIIAIIKASIE